MPLGGELAQRIGRRIRAARLGRRPRMTLAELGGGAITAAMVSKIEHGQVLPSLPTLLYLARRLGISPAELLDAETAGDLSAQVLLAQALLAAGQHDEAARMAEQAASMAARAGAAAEQCRALLVLAAAQRTAGHLDRAEAALEQAATAAPAQQDAELAAALRVERALLELEQGRSTRGQEHLQEVISLARAANAWPARAAQALLLLGREAERRRQFETAHLLYRQAQTLLQELARPTARAAGRLQRARRLHDRAPFQAALDACRAEELYSLIEAQRLAAELELRLAALALEEGRQAEALRHLRHALDSGTSADVELPSTLAQTGTSADDDAAVLLARLCRSQGDLVQFDELIERAITARLQAGRHDAARQLMIERGDAWRDAGDYRRAAEAYRRAALLHGAQERVSKG